METPFKLLFLSFFFASATCFNITKILDQHPEFNVFNSYLTLTKVVGEINKRNTITILAIEDSAMSNITGGNFAPEVLHNIMSVHVVLDYYDSKKLDNLSEGTALLTALFQSTGSAVGQQGFLNVTKSKQTGEILFGSAVLGSALSAKLVKSVASEPYNISVLQISGPIIPQGIDKSNNASKGSPSVAPAPAPKASAPAPKASAPATEAPTPSSPALAPPGNHTPAPTPAPEGPTSPPENEGPTAAPLASPPSPPAAEGPGPAAEGPDGSAQGPSDSEKSAGARVVSSTCLVAVLGFLGYAVL
ncbi:hypothetical protein AMTRI_Chr12g241190 [Amborella trichopoda]